MYLLSSWRKSSEGKDRHYGKLAVAAGDGLKHDGRWVALYPVIMRLPSSVAGINGPEKTKQLSMYARQALKRSARHSGIKSHEPQKDTSGVPRPSDGVYWSLSHSDKYVAAVVAPSAVGIDIEEMRDVSDGLKIRIASEAEWQLAPLEEGPALFFRYWTAKEAVLKAAGHGLLGLASCRVTKIFDSDRMQLSYQGADWLVHQHKIPPGNLARLPGCIAAITPGSNNVLWQVVDISSQ